MKGVVAVAGLDVHPAAELFVFLPPFPHTEVCVARHWV